MARPLRIQFEGAWYHVMNRGRDRCDIFHDHNDRKTFLSLLGETVNQWNIEIHAYSLMKNHYHLFVRTPFANLSRAMRHIDGVYTQKFNRRYEKDGSLFRGRFKSILVEKESYYLELVRYIHLNGVRAQQYKSALEDPYCSHRAYMRESYRPKWLTTEDVLKEFGGNQREAQSGLELFIKDGVSSKLAKQLEGKKWPSILGSEVFAKYAKNVVGEGFTKNSEYPQRKELDVLKNPLIVLEETACSHGVSVSYLKEKKYKRGETNKPRRDAIYRLRLECQLTYKDIAKLLGGVGYSSIARVCKQMARKSKIET